MLQGTESYSDNVLASGTVRGRSGYAPGSWLFYATGGFAWTNEQFQLTSANGTDSTIQQRVGWAAGVGVEGPLIPHWTVRAEYLYTGYGNRNINFPNSGQLFTSNLAEQEFLNLGGLGSFVGDGLLPNPLAENVLEAYYSWQLNAQTSLTFDYQLFANPGFNGDRGPVNMFATRIHWQY